MEIERKFLVREPPADLDRHPAERIDQGYLALDDGVEVRVRRRGGRATMTVKQGAGLVRVEEEVPIGRARFERLWPLTEGRRVEKVRHLVPAGDVTLEVDVYGGDLAGLVVAEAEFDSVAASDGFQPPAWVGDEVTGDPRYANRTLASEGWPAAPPAFGLAADESVEAGVRRIARGRLDKAIGRLETAPPETLGEAVHSARKSLKRLRSTVRLARDELGDAVYRRENTAFRDAGRELSGARDSQVMLETLDDLVEPGTFLGLRDALAAEHEAAQARLREDAGAVEGIVGELRDARSRTAQWSTDHADLDALAGGFERIYRRGRKALRAALDDPGDETLHELRKRVKDLWYASEIIRPASPRRTKKLADAASDLSDVIGLDHDLAVLRETADRHRDALADGELAALLELIARRRAKLQRQALKAGRRLYRRKPRKALRRIDL